MIKVETSSINDLVIERFIENYNDESGPLKIGLALYLIDWKHVLKTGKPITDFKYLYIGPQPKIEGFIEYLQENKNFTIKQYKDKLKGLKILNKYSNSNNLPKEYIETIDFVSNIFNTLDFTQICRLVYSTYPLTQRTKEQNRAEINLRDYAIQYSKDPFSNVNMNWIQDI